MKEPKQRKQKKTVADAATDAPAASSSERAPRGRKRATAKSTVGPAASSTTAQSREHASHTELARAEEQIRTRAYLRYLERGGTHGRALEDWLHAEREHHGGGEERRRG